MRPNKVKALWRQNKPAVAGWCSSGNPYIAEVMAHAGYDALVIDMQHGMGITPDKAIACLQAISTVVQEIARNQGGQAAVEGGRLITDWSQVRIPAGPPEGIREVFDDMQVLANDMIIQFEQPGLGAIRAVNIPFRLSANSEEPWLRRHAPIHGKHTFEVLQEVGCTREEVQSMAEARC